MSAASAGRVWGTAVFHLRMAGCGGCSDIVDVLLRDRFRGRPRLVECSSPRHAGLVIVSGVLEEEMESGVLNVLAQAPAGVRVLAVGGCATGAGATPGACPGVSFSERVKADGKVPGCPVTMEALIEGVEDVNC